MNNYNLHFQTQTPCNLYVNGELFGVIDNNNSFYVDLVVYKDNLIVSCEPINNDDILLIPFSFKLNYKNNKLTSSSNNVKLIPFPNNHFDCYITFKQSLLGVSNIINKKLGSFSVLATINTVSTISIFNGDDNLYTTQTKLITNLKFEQLNKLIILSANYNNQCYLLIFNTENNKCLVDDMCIKVEKNNLILKALKSLNNTLYHGKVFEVDLTNGSVKNYNVYLQNFEPIKEPSLIPYTFLECVKAKDFNLAKTFLDPEVGNVSNQKLEQYFSGINEIYYNCYYQDPTKKNYTIIGNTIKNFNFYVRNNKITEIEEETL